MSTQQFSLLARSAVRFRSGKDVPLMREGSNRRISNQIPTVIKSAVTENQRGQRSFFNPIGALCGSAVIPAKK
jgi:hypothetical protein